MNERILELARQIWPDPSISHANHMRFAELIVRECAKIVTIWSDEEPCSEGYDITPVYKMKQYFGVE